jgi:hypothetical protein
VAGELIPVAYPTEVSPPRPSQVDGASEGAFNGSGAGPYSTLITPKAGALFNAEFRRRFSFSAIALRIMESPLNRSAKLTAMPDEPSTPEICNRPDKA